MISDFRRKRSVFLSNRKVWVQKLIEAHKPVVTVLK